MMFLCIKCLSKLHPLNHRAVGSLEYHVRRYATPQPRPSQSTNQLKETAHPLNPLNVDVDDDIIMTSSSCDGSWNEQHPPLSHLPHIYMKLSKYRLTSLVVLTSLTGYAMAPPAAPVMSSITLLNACIGTALCSAAANTFNQWLEVPFDSQMARTRNRVLVRGQISPLHALSFGIISGCVGSTILYVGVNSLTASLGIFNIFLYSAVYTPMKRLSIVNTWVGSVVGAIPPLMGWAACTGALTPPALVLGAVLYAWQFPHFNALSWSLRADYSRGGYRMMAVTHPVLCRKVALRYCMSLIPICSLAAPLTGLTSWWFALDSLPLNVWFTYLAWRFYNDSDFKSARRLFRFSLFHLPLLLGLMFINKTEWKKTVKQSEPEHNEVILSL